MTEIGAPQTREGGRGRERERERERERGREGERERWVPILPLPLSSFHMSLVLPSPPLRSRKIGRTHERGRKTDSVPWHSAVVPQEKRVIYYTACATRNSQLIPCSPTLCEQTSICRNSPPSLPDPYVLHEHVPKHADRGREEGKSHLLKVITPSLFVDVFHRFSSPLLPSFSNSPSALPSPAPPHPTHPAPALSLLS